MCGVCLHSFLVKQLKVCIPQKMLRCFAKEHASFLQVDDAVMNTASVPEEISKEDLAEQNSETCSMRCCCFSSFPETKTTVHLDQCQLML